MRSKLVYSTMAFLVLGGLFASCNTACPNENNPGCGDVAPNGPCFDVYERWFYNSSSKSCASKVYIGCSPLGFETEEECESCLCDYIISVKHPITGLFINAIFDLKYIYETIPYSVVICRRALSF
ncbi:MAG: BPTI/Kunitz domain-containing protein [Flavobacteriales bacterium]|nr:BPTI/Kunitz domain-containing protein [Flavobacteriales bacterium]